MHHFLGSASVGKFMAKSLQEVIDEYEKERATLHAKLERVDSILNNLRQAEALARSAELAKVRVPNPTSAPVSSAQSQANQARPALTPDEVIREARNVLLEVGKPLKRGALVRAIEAKGLLVPGTDKAKNLGTILWRANRTFASIEKYGYWPIDVDLPGIYDLREQN